MDVVSHPTCRFQEVTLLTAFGSQALVASQLKLTEEVLAVEVPAEVVVTEAVFADDVLAEELLVVAGVARTAEARIAGRMKKQSFLKYMTTS